MLSPDDLLGDPPPEQLCELTSEQLHWMAEVRAQRHEGQASSRPLSVKYELVGLLGELAFCRQFRFPLIRDKQGRGDGHKDAGLWVGLLTFDVKAAQKPAHLLREVHKPHGDILILAHSDLEAMESCLLGWEFDANMLKCPVKPFNTEHPIPSHFKPRRHLRPMAELHAWVRAIRAKRQDQPHGVA